MSPGTATWSNSIPEESAPWTYNRLVIDLDNDSPRSAPAQLAALRTWARAALDLDATITVMVTELTCMEPGCPPLETVVAVMLPQGASWQFKRHKPAADFDADDRARLVEAWRRR